MLDVAAKRDSASERATTATRIEARPPIQPLSSFGLTARMLVITISSVLVAMTLLYAMRLEASREVWLHNKIATTRAAIEAFDVSERPMPDDLAHKVLHTLGLKSIALLLPDGRREIASDGNAPSEVVDLSPDDAAFTFSPREMFQMLFPKPGTTIRVAGQSPPIEIIMDERPLSEAMWRVSHTLLTISVVIAIVVTLVVWAALWSMVLHPVRRLTSAIIEFGERPHDMTRVIAPRGKADEIGRAETALAAMQVSLVHELAQRKRLAELGMAVARINHDLRNMLTAAQLISDRLAAIPDPLAQRLAPRLVATLDRAIQFCQATLTFGAGHEQAPNRRPFDLSELVRQIVDAAKAENEQAVEYHIDIPPQFHVYADPDHILRVLENLSRNAAQALRAKGPREGRPAAVRFAAIRTDGVALFEISDTGPGFRPDQSERIFEPFHKSEVGAGLGLSIAADLVSRNGGVIELALSKSDDFFCGARFLIKLPTAERSARKALPRAA
jgi:signal transduction histidine kinase